MVLQSRIYGNRGLVFDHGYGAELFDRKGNRYIDFFTGHGASLFGHVHPVLVSALEKAARVPWSPGVGLVSDARNQVAEVFAILFPGFRVYFGNSGTESVEAALKVCAINRPGRRRTLALRRSFHGRTLGSLSLTFNPRYREPFSRFLFDAEHFAPEKLAAAIDEETAAVFIEPVQGEGGVHPLPQDIGEAITERCRNTGALLVADEIQTGFGRCGSILASGGAGLDPDVICMSKGVAGGLPIGVTLWRQELEDFPAQSHGSTTGGNPLVCAVAGAALGLLTERDYPARAGEMGSLFKGLINKTRNAQIREVRGQGLLIGVELRGKSAPVVKALQERGVLALPAGPSVVRFLPPFVAEEEHYREVASLFEEVLESNGNKS